jgi:hypothetical protein
VGFPQRQAAIVGVFTTEQGKLPERTSFSLQLEAIKGAVDDAGLTLTRRRTSFGLNSWVSGLSHLSRLAGRPGSWPRPPPQSGPG